MLEDTLACLCTTLGPIHRAMLEDTLACLCRPTVCFSPGLHPTATPASVRIKQPAGWLDISGCSQSPLPPPVIHPLMVSPARHCFHGHRVASVGRIWRTLHPALRGPPPGPPRAPQGHGRLLLPTRDQGYCPTGADPLGALGETLRRPCYSDFPTACWRHEACFSPLRFNGARFMKGSECACAPGGGPKNAHCKRATNLSAPQGLQAPRP